MNTYEIVPKHSNYLRRFVYLGALLGALYLFLTYDSYQEEGWSFETITNLIVSFAWLVIPFVQFKSHPYDYGKITLLERGVAFGKKDGLQTIGWNDIDNIKMTNNSLFFNLTDQTQKEFSISFMGYKQLQTAKKNIRRFSDPNNVDFSSKY